LLCSKIEAKKNELDKKDEKERKGREAEETFNPIQYFRKKPVNV
jgi:hypothetical protein